MIGICFNCSKEFNTTTKYRYYCSEKCKRESLETGFHAVVLGYVNQIRREY